MKRRYLLASVLSLAAACSTLRNRPPAITGVRRPLQFAVTDEQGMAPLLAEYEAFRQALTAALATEVAFFPVDNYTAAAIGLSQGHIDLALTGPAEYVLIRARTNATPVLALTRPDYYSVIAVPAHSPIDSVADLRGKTIAMKEIGSTSGHLGPTLLLLQAGLDPLKDVEIQMLGEAGSLAAMHQGQVTAWGGGVRNYETDLQPAGYRLLARGVALPSDVLVASSHLTPEQVDRLRTRILDQKETLMAALASQASKYEASQFVTADDGDYDIIRQLYDRVGQGTFVGD